MLEMYTWMWPARSLTALLLALCVLSQTLLLALSLYRQPRGRRWLAENCLELALLLHILCCSLLHGRVMHAYEATLIATTGNEALRIVTFGLVALAAVATALHSRRPWQLLAVPATCVMLPLVERLLGGLFSYAYVAALPLYLMRSGILCVTRYGELRMGISSHAVRRASHGHLLPRGTASFAWASPPTRSKAP